MRERTGFRSLPRFSDDPLVTAAFWLLTGYLLLGRSFAQIGLPSVNLFLGEVLLITMFLDQRVRRAFNDAVSALTRPGPLHVLMWSMVLFVGFGVLQLLLGVRAGYPVIEAAKNLVFNYYVVLLITGLVVGVAMPRFIQQLAYVVPRINPFVVLVLLPLRGNLPLPIAVIPGAASAVSIALLLTCHRPGHMRSLLIALNTVALLYLQVRGDWLGVVLAVLLWAFLDRRWKALAVAGLAGLVLVSVVAAADIRIPGAPERGGTVTPEEVFARAIAPANPELAARFSDEAAFFEGTASWRQSWWDEIWVSVHVDDEHVLFGHGYGYPLAGLADFDQDAEAAPLRTPHSVFFYALGYTGWLGVAVFGLFHFVVLRLLFRVRRLTGNPFGPMLWVLGTTAALFGNFFETPYNAAPFWFLVGVVLAPLVGAKLPSAKTTDDRSTDPQGPTDAMPAR